MENIFGEIRLICQEEWRDGNESDFMSFGSIFTTGGFI